ncbi:MAG TPA: NYN domain-containing protein [Aggregatilineales bacterium]|nr:NYN domain-containing protein [Aggregatilineales bacterium]
MSAYLVVDVDEFLERVNSRFLSIDLYDLATKLRSNAAMAAGLSSPTDLKAIAVADWDAHRTPSGQPIQHIFDTVGFKACNVLDRDHLVDTLIDDFFSSDTAAVDELILVTSSPELMALPERIKLKRSARVRIWADVEPDSDKYIFQPLESILGLQSKTVAMYIDFENIAISLNEQGYAVNLDRVIHGLTQRAAAYGQVNRMAAYAPWGQRGSLPPLTDDMGREVSDEAPSRLLLANIDPVFNLPGKNSADMRIAKDVLADSVQPSAPDTFIIASGDRDFNDVLSALRTRNRHVIVWGVRGSTSRMLENNPSVQIEYLDDFLPLQRHEAVREQSEKPVVGLNAFTPSQWSSVILQYDRLAALMPGESIPIEALQEQLRRVNAVVSEARGRDLVMQAVTMGILEMSRSGSTYYAVPAMTHPIVEKARLVRDRIVLRVANTLDVRGWEYVNYGFLLKGIAMDRELDRPGLNIDDAWRSDWVDCLVREGILVREMVPHRHNPEDLVPVIKLSPTSTLSGRLGRAGSNGHIASDDTDAAPDTLSPRNAETEAMMKRIIVSVDQFTSYRGFTWCPLGSLHRRLRAYDSGVVFQRAVEWLVELKAVVVEEYDNPQSTYKTKGISLNMASRLAQDILQERDEFVRSLLDLYEQHVPINLAALSRDTNLTDQALDLWLTIMQAENVLNPVPGKPGLFSLFRTHHTVNLVADSRMA